ncbi:hypothetical protein LR48_Vigan11g056600 [Vigna angularis]|uniref:Uncharacterized protein n=1 Tax=Phaseolus angularis TaxID=3914 RepID=A0A0L9VRG3_PHAAN|nr:hypothetical protein LR48_Vigan11g056600 [Vigna angularis]
MAAKSSLNDVFQQCMQESISTLKSIEASCKRMETQIGNMIQKLDDFGVDTEVNPRNECQAIITRSDKILDEKKIERKEKEELSEKYKDVEKEREVVERVREKKICVKMKKVRGKRERKKKVREKKKRTRVKKKESYEKPLPHPKKCHRKKKEFKHFKKIFKKLEIKVPMIETLQQGWPPHQARDSRLQYSKGRRRNQINPILASSFPVSMSNTSSLSKIAWQEEQAHARRVGAAEAPAMEEDDEDDDFEDAEEGEEEDSDDSMS